MQNIAWILVCVFAFAFVVVSVLLFRIHKKTKQSKDPKNGEMLQKSDVPKSAHQHGESASFLPELNNANGAAENENEWPDDFGIPASDQDDDRTVLVSPSVHSQPRRNIDPLEVYPYLRVVSGPDSGNIFSLPFSATSFGRSIENSFSLTDDSVSRHHFEVEYIRPRYVLRDSGSTNGTFCNSQPVGEVMLEFGDEIQFGDTLMIFTCAGIELLEDDPKGAAVAFGKYLEVEPEFLLALKNLAFLLERDIRRKTEAEPLWKEVARLEKLV